MNNEIQEMLARKFQKRFQDYNKEILKELGKIIKKFNGLGPDEAFKLGQILKYDLSAKRLEKKLAEILNKSEKEVRELMEEIAKQNLQFSKTYYEARGLKVPIYKESGAIQSLVESVAKITNDNMKNIARTTGFVLKEDGVSVAYRLTDLYKKVVDESIYSITTGKENYYERMKKIMLELADSGLQEINYDNVGTVYRGHLIKEPYHRRLDSSARMNILDGMRQVHNGTQEIVGRDFKADGVEISVHLNPAPDHEEIQGKQFTKKEFDKFQRGEVAVSYDGIIFDGSDKRAISEYNCYHYIFSVILGSSVPSYSNEELQDIINKKNETFEFEGKTYNKYEGTQIQRRIETEIRRLEDMNVIAESSGAKNLVAENQIKINMLKSKYLKLVKASGLRNQLRGRTNLRGR